MNHYIAKRENGTVLKRGNIISSAVTGRRFSFAYVTDDGRVSARSTARTPSCSTSCRTASPVERKPYKA